MKKTLKKKGFTLIELIVVIAILAVLALLLVPQMQNYLNKSKDTVDISNVEGLNRLTLSYAAFYNEGNLDPYDQLGSDDLRQDELIAKDLMRKKVTPANHSNTIEWDHSLKKWVLKLSGGQTVFTKDGTILDQREHAFDYAGARDMKYGDVVKVTNPDGSTRFIKCISSSGCNGTPPSSEFTSSDMKWKDISLTYYLWNNYEKNDVIEFGSSHYIYVGSDFRADTNNPDKSKDFKEVVSDGKNGWVVK